MDILFTLRFAILTFPRFSGGYADIVADWMSLKTDMEA
jgi:hypothetical protein